MRAPYTPPRNRQFRSFAARLCSSSKPALFREDLLSQSDYSSGYSSARSRLPFVLVQAHPIAYPLSTDTLIYKRWHVGAVTPDAIASSENCLFLRTFQI